MNGPSEFTVVVSRFVLINPFLISYPLSPSYQGTLKDWDFTSRLPSLTMPILIVSGGWDEAAPFIQEKLKAGLPHAEQRIFEHSAHCPHAEERDAYMEVVGDFLKRHDS